jgi:hypothetical protein
MITDCHIHIQPIELFKPEALALMKKSRKDFDQGCGVLSLAEGVSQASG